MFGVKLLAKKPRDSDDSVPERWTTSGIERGIRGSGLYCNEMWTKLWAVSSKPEHFPVECTKPGLNHVVAELSMG